MIYYSNKRKNLWNWLDLYCGIWHLGGSRASECLYIRANGDSFLARYQRSQLNRLKAEYKIFSVKSKWT
jgi:hypothetical protein